MRILVQKPVHALALLGLLLGAGAGWFLSEAFWQGSSTLLVLSVAFLAGELAVFLSLVLIWRRYGESDVPVLASSPLSRVIAAVVLPFMGGVCLLLGIVNAIPLIVEAIMPTCTSYVNQYNGATMSTCSGFPIDLGAYTALVILGLLLIRMGRRFTPFKPKASEPDVQEQAAVIQTDIEPGAKSKPTKATMYCSQCGAVIPRGSKFCKECGTKQT